MKRISLFLLTISCLTLLACATGKDKTSGTITYLDFEGGFYGIITEDNTKLLPINLDEAYWINGKKIKFNYTEKTDMMSIHQWGILVEISGIDLK